MATLALRVFPKLCSAYNLSHFASRGVSNWDLVGAVCIERKPVISKELLDIEKEYSEYLSIIEKERSLKSKHEIRKENEQKTAKLAAKQELDDDSEAAIESAQDLEDKYQEELELFKYAPRRTIADEKQDLKSTTRSLDQHLLLIIEQKLGSNHKWVVPQTFHVEGETLRQTAERALVENCGKNMQVKFYGNAPSGFYKYKYPKSEREAVGAKVFFFKAKLLSGSVEIDKKHVKDYKWLNRSELEDSLSVKYHKSLSEFLISE